jgi:hypothetical protein
MTPTLPKAPVYCRSTWKVGTFRCALVFVSFHSELGPLHTANTSKLNLSNSTHNRSLPIVFQSPDRSLTCVQLRAPLQKVAYNWRCLPGGLTHCLVNTHTHTHSLSPIHTSTSTLSRNRTFCLCFCSVCSCAQWLLTCLRPNQMVFFVRCSERQSEVCSGFARLGEEGSVRAGSRHWRKRCCHAKRRLLARVRSCARGCLSM